MSTICKTCGATVSDDETRCPYCDSPIEKPVTQHLETHSSEFSYDPHASNDSESPVHISTTEEFGKAKFWGFVIISFLLPIVGWILYFVYEDKNIEAARTFSKFAWYGIIWNLIIYVFSHC